MNYIIAEQQLNSYKAELNTKYGKGFKGSNLSDNEIEQLFRLKEQLSNNSISKADFIKQVVSR